MTDFNYNNDTSLNELKELRHKLSDMAYKVQKRIDEIILEKNDFLKYNKKFIYVKNSDGETYMYVTNIRIFNNGCSLRGIAYRNENDYFIITTDLAIDYQINSNTKIEIITENDFYNKLYEIYQNTKCKLQKIIQND